jgi:hypothetical protein
VPVEVVGGEVEPRRHLRAQARGPGQAEAAALDDERIDVEVEGVDERRLGVAGRDGTAPAHVQHRRGQQRGRRLPVGAGDRQDRARPAGTALLPLPGEVDLAADGQTALVRFGDQRVMLGQPGRGHDELHGVEQLGALPGVRRHDQVEAEPFGGSGRARRVVGGEDRPSSAGERGSAGLTGDGQPVDERGAGAH